MNISIVGNTKKLAKDIEKAARSQVPFAEALALTWTAKDVQREVVDALPDSFTIRGTWVARSFRVTAAKKGHDPKAVVGSIYEPMALQAEGGVKAGEGHDVAVPVRARASPGAVTRPATWPGRLLARKGFFATRGAHGGGLIFQRIGRGAKKSLRLWWVLKNEVKIEPRWPFSELAAATVKRELATNFHAAMDRALQTKR